MVLIDIYILLVCKLVRGLNMPKVVYDSSDSDDIDDEIIIKKTYGNDNDQHKNNNTNTNNTTNNNNDANAAASVPHPYYYSTSETNSRLWSKNPDFVSEKTKADMVLAANKRLFSEAEMDDMIAVNEEKAPECLNCIVEFKRARKKQGHVNTPDQPDETYLFAEYIWKKYSFVSQRLLLSNAVRLELQKSIDLSSNSTDPSSRVLLRQVKEEIKYMELIKTSLQNILTVFQKDSVTA